MGSFLTIASARREDLGSVCVAFLCRVKRRLRRRNGRRRASIRAIRVNVYYRGRFIVSWSFRAILCIRDDLGRIGLFVLVCGLLNRPMEVRQLAARARCYLDVCVATLNSEATHQIALNGRGTTFLLLISFNVVRIGATIARLAIVGVYLFNAFAYRFNRSNCDLALFLQFLGLLRRRVNRVHVFIRVIVSLDLCGVACGLVGNEAAKDRVNETRLSFDLAFRRQFLRVGNGNDCRSIASVNVIRVLIRVFLSNANRVLFRDALVHASLHNILSISGEMVLLAVLTNVHGDSLSVFSFRISSKVWSRDHRIIIGRIRRPIAKRSALAIVSGNRSYVRVNVITRRNFRRLQARAMILGRRIVQFGRGVDAILFYYVLYNVHRRISLNGNDSARLSVAVTTRLRA